MGTRENECQISQNYILPVKSQFLSNLTFIFSDFHEKFSLGLLQMIYYIFSPSKM